MRNGTPLDITVYRDRPDTVVLALAGDCDTDTVPEVHTTVDNEISRMAPRATLVIDLSGVGALDSSGLSALIMAQRRADAAGIALLLRGVRRHLHGVLRRTGLAVWFAVTPDPGDEPASPVEDTSRD